MKCFNWNWELIVFFTFLTVNLIIGLYHGRKVKTIKDYALGGRNFSTGTLVSTIVATVIGGDYLFITLAEVYKTGLHYTIGCLGMVSWLLLNAYLFIPRMGEFLGSMSVAEAMGDLYGKHIRIISAICGTIASAGFIAVQFKVFGEVLKNFVGLPGNSPIFLAASIVVIYSAFGGIRSVTYTDVIQFFTFGVLIPVLGFIIWNDSINLPLVHHVTNNHIFNYKNFLGFSNPNFWSIIVLFIFYSLPDINPVLFQRVAIGRSIVQVKKAFAISAVLLMLILLGMAWIAYLLYKINPNLPPETLVQYIIDHYSYSGLKIFILIGIVAMCMSTADSNINSSSVLLTHDFCYPLNIKFKNEIILSKLISIILGIISIFLALLNYDLLPLVFMTQSFYIPIIDVPLILAILGFRSTAKSVLIGMAAGLIGVIVWRVFFMDVTNIDSILPGMIVNFIFFMGSHYLLKQSGGWNKDNKSIINYQPVFNKTIKNIREFNLLTFCKNNAPKNEFTYTGFGIFCLISTVCTMYSLSSIVNKHTLLSFYESMLIFSICFITYPVWPSTMKKDIIIQIAWNIGVFYLLIVCSCFFVLLSSFAHVQLTIFILNLIVVAILTRWNVAFAMIIAGIYVAVQVYKYYIHVDYINIVVENPKLILYSLLLVGAAIIVFLKPKQQYEKLSEIYVESMKEKEQQQQKDLIRSLQHQVEFVKNLDNRCIKIFNSIHEKVNSLNKNLNKAKSTKEVKEISKQLIQATEKLQYGAEYLSEVIYNAQNLIKIKVNKVNVKQLTTDILQKYGISYRQCSFIIDLKTKCDEIYCDPYLLAEVVKNLIEHMILIKGKETVIKIIVIDDVLTYPLSFTNEYTKKIKGLKFSIIHSEKETHTIKTDFFSEQTCKITSELMFTNIYRIISAHYGIIDIKDDLDCISYSFIIPVNVNEIRPKLMDLPTEKLDNIETVVELINKTVADKMFMIAKELESIGLEPDVISKIIRV